MRSRSAAGNYCDCSWRFDGRSKVREKRKIQQRELFASRTAFLVDEGGEDGLNLASRCNFLLASWSMVNFFF